MPPAARLPGSRTAPAASHRPGVATPTSPAEGYAPPPPEGPPLAGYGALIGAFAAAVSGSLLAIRRSGRELPERVGAGDVVLLGTATHKLSRLIAKDKVTGVARAPFTEYEGSAGPSEVSESPRGTGVRRAIGELVTCPWCVGMWVAFALTLGIVAAPRLTRLIASALSVLALSDFLQIAYKAAEERGL